MIDCSQYRRAILANPHDTDVELAAHRDSCGECAAYTERLLRFEGKLERALRVQAPDAAKGVTALRPRRTPLPR